MSISRAGHPRPLVGLAVVMAAMTPMLGACGGSSPAASSKDGGATTAVGATSAASSPSVTSTSSISTALSSSSAAPAVSSSAAPNGPDCGQIGADGNGSVVRLVITGGTLSCAEAKKVWTDYGSAAKEGSGGFATVDDAWQCAHGSVADLQQTGVQGGCQNGPKAFETRISSLSGGPSGGASGSSSASAANGAPAGCTASSKGQLTGSELAAILACISSFPTGASAALHTADSGSQLVPQPTDPGQLYRSASCVDNATLPDFSVLGTAYARREYAVTSAFSATVDQFQDNATASAFLGDRRAYVQRCAASQFPGSAWQATSVGGLPGVLFTMPGLREVIVVDGTELIDVSANTPANQSPATSTAPEKVAADIVAAFSH